MCNLFLLEATAESCRGSSEPSAGGWGRSGGTSGLATPVPAKAET